MVSIYVYHSIRRAEVEEVLRKIPLLGKSLLLANEYLPPEAGGTGNEKQGFTEPPAWYRRAFGAPVGVDDGSIDSWFEHGGTTLVQFEDEKTEEFLGHVLLCLPRGYMIQEGGSVEQTVNRFNEIVGGNLDPARTAWIFYSHLNRQRTNKAFARQFVRMFRRWIEGQGVDAVVADYLIPSEELGHTCVAGRNIMKACGFVEVEGATYDNSAEREEFHKANPGEAVAPLMEFQLMLWDLRKSKA